MDLDKSKCSDTNEEAPEAPAQEAEPERGTWTGRFDFLLSLLGYSVGLGNVWRFPYLCYNNGGGAFLIPFTIMLIIAGLPLMFMELSFGQYAALGPVAVYNRFCPLFRGLGYGMVIVSCIVMLYYNLIIAWTIYYMVVSFGSIFYQLPWQNCNADWSTKHCYSYEEADLCESTNGTYYLRQCFNQTYSLMHNISALADVAIRKPPAEEYFTNQVLGLSSGIEETGHIRLEMAACLFAAWLIVFLCLCKGVKSSGKVVYFTALFPYVVLVILFFRGVTLPGASTGILFYLTPDFSQLANAQVWGDAAVQIFFALSPAWGGLITLSSYNKFSNNCYIDSLIVAASNIATSFFAGLVIFSVIGFLAHELEVEVDKVVDQGAGLAFIVYPEVVTRLPVSPLWSILFFVMLLTLGLDSQFALMETVTTAILDRFPNLRQRKGWVVFSVAVFGYVGGLIFTTNSGMYWLQLMDKYAANWSVLIIAIGECILIAWIYGAEKFCGDIQRMIGKQSKLWVIFWSAMWRVITPAALVFILAFNWIEYKPASYGHYVYPMWADAVGWTLGVLPVVVVVLMAVDQICSGPDDLTIMEKSQDAGDGISISSGLENELRKASANLIKSTKNSFKRKVQTFSHDSDDAVIEPLLQKEKEKSDTSNSSAKLSSKIKTDSINDDGSDKKRLLEDGNELDSENNGIRTTDNFKLENGKTHSQLLRIIPSSSTNSALCSESSEEIKNTSFLKKISSTEINSSKQDSFKTSPVIFTTAKIHSNSKTKIMEQVTSVPLLATVESGSAQPKNILETNDIKQTKTDRHSVQPQTNSTKTKVNTKREFSNIQITTPTNTIEVIEARKGSEINAKPLTPNVIPHPMKPNISGKSVSEPKEDQISIVNYEKLVSKIGDKQKTINESDFNKNRQSSVASDKKQLSQNLNLDTEDQNLAKIVNIDTTITNQNTVNSMKQIQRQKNTIIVDEQTLPTRDYQNSYNQISSVNLDTQKLNTVKKELQLKSPDKAENSSKGSNTIIFSKAGTTNKSITLENKQNSIKPLAKALESTVTIGAINQSNMKLESNLNQRKNAVTTNMSKTVSTAAKKSDPIKVVPCIEKSVVTSTTQDSSQSGNATVKSQVSTQPKTFVIKTGVSAASSIKVPVSTTKNTSEEASRSTIGKTIPPSNCTNDNATRSSHSETNPNPLTKECQSKTSEVSKK